MSTATFARTQPLRIRRILGDTFVVFGRYFVPCIILSAIFFVLPFYLNQTYFSGWAKDATAAAGRGEWANYIQQMVVFGGGLYLIGSVLGAIFEAVLVHVTIDHLNDRKPVIVSCLARTLTMLAPIIGVSIILYSGIMIGLLMLTIPGIYFFLRWYVAIPVLVQERCGVLNSLSRSAALTKGSRWRILVLVVVLYIPITVAQLGLGWMTGNMGGVPSILQLVIVGLTSVVLSIAPTVTYVELRRVQEGAGTKELMEIFA